MKARYLIIFTLFFTNAIQGQQIDISGLYSSSTVKQLKNNWGYDLKYNHFINKNRIGLSFKHYFYNTEYDNIRTSLVDGVTKYIEEQEPQNRRIAINLIYSYILVENEKSNLYIGCNAGINYFHFRGVNNSIRITDGYVTKVIYPYEYTKKNRLGFGFLIEYEINEVFSERFSTSITINPELTAFAKWGMTGGYAPWTVRWLNFSISLKYKLID